MGLPLPPPPRAWPARLARAAIWATIAVVLSVLFVAASMGALFLHLDLPATRRLTTTLVGAGLSQVFAGKFSVGAIETLRPDRVELGEISVLDPQGQEVLRITRLRAHADLWVLARRIFWDTGAQTLVIDHVRAERAECQVIPNPKTGIPTLAEAFYLQPSQRTGKALWTPQGPFEVRLPSIEIGKAWGQGRFENLPLLDAEVTRAKGTVVVRPGSTEIDVERFGAALRGIGGAVAQGTSTLHIRVPGAVSGSFEGRVGDVEVVANLRSEGRKLLVELSLPGAEADALRVLWPAWPLRDRLGGRLRAEGTLPVLETRAELEAGREKVTARGPVRLTGDVGAHMELKAEHLDLSSLISGAPATDIESTGAVTFLVRQGRVAATFNAATRPTVIAGQMVPPVDLTGHLNPQGLESKLTLHEPGVALEAEVTLAPDGSLNVTAKTGRFRLQQSPRLRALSRADADTDLEIQAHLDKSHLDASLQSSFRDLSWGPIHLGQGRLNARLRGAISALEQAELEADLESSDVKAGLFSLTHVEARARGPLGHPEVRARVADAHGLELTLTGRVTPASQRVDNLVVIMSRAGASLQGKVRRLDLAGGTVDVSDLELTGAGGHLTGSLRLRPDLAEIQAEGTDLDLDVVSRVLGLPAGLAGGKARITADVSVGTDVSRGRLRLSVKDGSIAYRRGIDWELAADLSKDRLEGSSQITIRDVGEFEARFNAELAGSPLRLVAWHRAVGQAALYVNRLDLAALHELPGAAEAGLGEVTGTVAGWVNVERRDPSAWPNVVVKLGSQGLGWVYGGSPSEPKRLEGIEVELGASLEGQTGRCQLAARAVDLQGTLAAATLQTELDLAWLGAHPRDFEQKLTETPVKAALDVPERALGDFPEPLRVSRVVGRVGGRVDLEGKPEDPTLSVKVSGRELRLEKSRFELPVDVDLAAQYQSTSGRLTGNAEVAQAGSRVAVLSWQADVPWQNLWLGSEPDQPSWRGAGELSLFSLPVASIPVLADARVGGSLKGTVKFQRQSLLPTAQADLELAQATVGNVSLGAGKLVLDASGNVVRAKITLTKDRGRLDANLEAGVAWANDFVALDAKRPIEVALHAQALDAGVLGPLTADVLTHVSGTLDGDVKGELVPVPAPDQPEKLAFTTRLTGNAELNDGSLGLAGLGLELRRVSGSARATTVGDTTKVELRDIAGSARSSQKNVKGWADLELVQGRVTSGKGALSVDQVPLPIEGVNMATIQGNATLELERTPDAMLVSVKVPKLVAKLPLSSTRTVIPLGDNPSITVAQPLGEPKEPSSGTVLVWVVAFELGSAVRVERGDVYLPVSGKPRLRFAEKTEVDGYVDLEPGGRLPALGKVFQVETGRVWFDSAEPSNPNIAVTASWRGPDATVYVDIRGRWRNAKLSLRSEPPRPEAEIMLVLLQGGSPEEAEAAGAKGQAFVGAQTAANALGVSDLFAGTPLGGLQLRADTSQGSGSYAATFRVSDRVWVEGIYRPQGGVSQSGGVSTSGNDPSQTQRQDSYAGAVDLRLGHDWTLRTEGGNASAAVDLLWQYRY